MPRGEMNHGGDIEGGKEFLTRPELLQLMVQILDYHAFYFSPEERDQGTIMAIPDKKKRSEIRATRERAVKIVMDEIDLLVKERRIPPDFFHGVADQAEFAAEVIKKMATEPVEHEKAA